MQINIVYDPDVARAPAGFTTAVTEAVAYLDQLISNNISISVEFGWGTSGPLDGNVDHAAAESLPAWVYLGTPSSSAVQGLLGAVRTTYAADGLSSFITPATLATALGSLPGSSTLAIGYAQALALNLVTPSAGGSAPISYVALNSSDAWNWNVNQAASPTALDAVAAIIHEITHDLGRTTGWMDQAGSPVATFLDLFRYSGIGVPQAGIPDSGFFSLDGRTLLRPFASAATDPADWVQTTPPDALGPAILGSSAILFSPLDKLELEALGFSLSSPLVPPVLTLTSGLANQIAPGTIKPFQAMTIADPNPGATESVYIQALHAGNLANFSNLGTGSTSATSDTYMVTGTPAQVTAAIDSLDFSNNGNSSSPITVSFSVTVTDSAGQQTADSATSVTFFAPLMTPTVIGTASDDHLSARNGVFWGGPGNDVIVGIGSLNTSLYDGPSSQFIVTQTNGTITVADRMAGRDGTDTLTNVQRLAFQDKIIAFDFTGDAGQAYRMYQAAFDRVPDATGLSYWVRQMDLGMSLGKLAQAFVNSTEFTTIYGSHPTTQALVSAFYSNVLERSADSTGLVYWNAQLQAGTTISTMLMSFSESAENQADVLPAIQSGIVLDPGLFT